MRSYGSGYSSGSGLSAANATVLFSNGSTNGLRVFTYDTTGLTLGTNNTSRMAINSVGAISTAFTGTNHSTNGFTSVITDITTSSAAYYTSGLLINATTNYVTSGITNSGEYVGVNSYAFINNADHAGTLTDNFGFNTASGINACASGGTITNNYGIRCYIYNGAGTMTNSYMFRGIVGTSGGTITNNWGIYLSGCEKNYVEGSLELVGSNIFRVGTPEGSTSSDATGLFKFISYGTNQAATNVVLGVLEEDAEANTYLVRMKSGNKTFADATDRFYVNSVGIGYLSSGLGVGAAPTATNIGYFKSDQNAESTLLIRNDTSGTGASALLRLDQSSTSYTILTNRNSSYTTSGLNVADSGCLLSYGNANGLRLFTEDATDLILGTNNTPRLTISSTGLISTVSTLSSSDAVSRAFDVLSNFRTTSDQTAYKLGINSRTSSSYVSSTYTESGEFIGVKATSYIESDSHQGILASLIGMYSDVGIATCGSGGTITNNIGVYVRVNNSDADGTITNSYFLKGAVGGSGGTITNNWGIHLSGCTKNYLAGTLDVVGGYKINGTDGVSFSGAVTNITVVNGIVTAAS
jgi:hypothetical protein